MWVCWSYIPRCELLLWLNETRSHFFGLVFVLFCSMFNPQHLCSTSKMFTLPSSTVTLRCTCTGDFWANEFTLRCWTIHLCSCCLAVELWTIQWIKQEGCTNSTMLVTSRNSFPPAPLFERDLLIVANDHNLNWRYCLKIIETDKHT